MDGLDFFWTDFVFIKKTHSKNNLGNSDDGTLYQMPG